MTWAVTTKTTNCATQLITAAEDNALEVSRAPGSSKITKMFIFLKFQFSSFVSNAQKGRAPKYTDTRVGSYAITSM